MKKSILSILSLALLFSTFLFPNASTTYAEKSLQESCQVCEGNLDDYVNATADQEKRIMEIVKQSDKYPSLKAQSTDNGSIQVKILKDDPNIGFALINDESKNERQLSIFGVDQEKEVVFANASFNFEKINNEEEILTIQSPQKKQSFRITKDGELYDLTNNQKINPEEISELTLTADYKDDEVNTMASCREYVGMMCSFMAGYGMAELCAMSFFAGGIAGVGCVVVYAAIATWGCASAMDLIC